MLRYELFKRMSEVMMRRLRRARSQRLETMGKIQRKAQEAAARRRGYETLEQDAAPAAARTAASRTHARICSPNSAMNAKSASS
jgi:hypothetical protein